MAAGPRAHAAAWRLQGSPAPHATLTPSLRERRCHTPRPCSTRGPAPSGLLRPPAASSRPQGSGAEDPAGSVTYLAVGAVVVALRNEHLLQLLPGLLLGVLPLGHAPGHICGRQQTEAASGNGRCGRTAPRGAWRSPGPGGTGRVRGAWKEGRIGVSPQRKSRGITLNT